MLTRQDVPTQLDVDLQAAIEAALHPGDVVRTIARAHRNVVVAIGPEGVTIETERSSSRGSAQLVPAWMFNVAWRELHHRGSLTRQELLAVAKRSSAVFAVLTALPTVEAVDRPASLKLVQ